MPVDTGVDGGDFNFRATKRDEENWSVVGRAHEILMVSREGDREGENEYCK